MKTLVKFAAVAFGIAAAGAAQAAPIPYGTAISINGYVQAVGAATLSAATGLDFVTGGVGASPGQPGVLTSYGTGQGLFAGMGCTGGNCGTIKDLPVLAPGAQSISQFLHLTGGNNASPIDFTVTGITSVDRTSPFLLFAATGLISFDGYDTTAAQFFFSAQNDVITSFSASTVSVVEPTSIALLGGALAIGAALRGRRRQAQI